MVAGQSSGVGKTTITLGLIAALRRRGLVVQPFKCGPDYIDPTYHTLAAGRPCRNLDTWMLTPEQMRAGFERACAGAHLAIIEGVMGLFDGASYDEESGSAAQIAKLLGAPVLLVLDIGKLARSAGALALGYQQFDCDTPLAGFILNNAGSESHARGCAGAITAATGLPVVGWLGKDNALRIPERHLGLIPTGEREALDRLIEAVGNAVEAGLDVAQILGIGDQGSGTGDWDRVEFPKSPNRLLSRRRRLTDETIADPPLDPQCPVPNRQSPTLAVARDEAFSFYYPDNLELLAAAGARIHFFSPLQNETLPPETAGVYLGGGFPEMYAERLSRNQALWADLRRLHARRIPIYAECGGFMALTEALVDLDGVRWPMAGLVPGETQMQSRLAGLGYRLASAAAPNLLLAEGESVRGHEFHYSTWAVDAERIAGHAAWTLRRRPGDANSRPDGYVDGNLLASYLHIHFGQRSAFAERFVAKMGTGD
ncbi:MAG: cobyrinate a,c-diamide synthase [Chloroflexi bacterium]|nr:cobyrinate a,c-diamide synthase [Chloroflexota bacterium]